MSLPTSNGKPTISRSCQNANIWLKHNLNTVRLVSKHLYIKKASPAVTLLNFKEFLHHISIFVLRTTVSEVFIAKAKAFDAEAGSSACSILHWRSIRAFFLLFSFVFSLQLQRCMWPRCRRKILRSFTVKNKGPSLRPKVRNELS